MLGSTPTAVGVAVLGFILSVAAQSSSPPLQVAEPVLDPTVFAAPVLAGAATGYAADLVGCLGNGATLKELTMWANDNFIRGIQAVLTDGRDAFWGCVNTTGRSAGGADTIGCNGANTRSITFKFSPGELVKTLTIWPGTDQKGAANSRAGFLHFETSLGRVFDFGMTGQRIVQAPTDVASGIPCGLAVRRGADIDALGFVFLLPVQSATLKDVQYDGVPCTEPCVHQGLTANDTPETLYNQTYDNKAETTDHTYTYASAFEEDTLASWAPTDGLDSYIQAQVDGSYPVLSASGPDNSILQWDLSPPALLPRTSKWKVPRNFSVQAPVRAGAVVQAAVTTVLGSVAVSYSGNLTLTLASSAVVSIPVTGNFTGTAYAPLAVKVTEIEAPPQPPPQPVAPLPDVSALSVQPAGGSYREMNATVMSSSHTNTGAIVGGVLGGVIALLLLLLLLLLLRQRNAPVDDGKGGGGGKGSPRATAWGIPVIFAGRDGGSAASAGGGGAGAKAPPSPIKSFRGFEDPLPRADSGAPLRTASSGVSGGPPSTAGSPVPLMTRVRALLGIGQREQLDDLDPNEAYLELGETSGPVTGPVVIDVSKIGAAASLPATSTAPRVASPRARDQVSTPRSGGPAATWTPNRTPKAAIPAGTPKDEGGASPNSADVGYDPDTAHWTKPPVPAAAPRKAPEAGQIEHDDVAIRTSDRRRHIETEGVHLKLGSGE